MHFNESSSLQLINGISNDLQKLLKYFSGTAIFTPFLFHCFQYYQEDFALYLNEGALLLLVTFSLLTISSNSINLLKYQNNCHYSQLNCT